MTNLDKDAAWDHVMAKDLPEELTSYVVEQLQAGVEPRVICKALGIKSVGSQQWKKIAAWLRQGMRASAEAYLTQQTTDFYRVLKKAREVLEDAFENGVPIVTQDTVGRESVTSVIRVKGATKELANFLAMYSSAVQTPVNLWKSFGMIGEKENGGQKGVTIVVNNSIPMPTVAEIKSHQEEMQKKMEAIEVKGTPVAETQST